MFCNFKSLPSMLKKHSFIFRTTDLVLYQRKYTTIKDEYSGSVAKKNARTRSITAVGISNFKTFVESSTIFIDKSLLIKDFVLSPAGVLLITCPRRWGKSLNMDMIKTFLEIEVNEDGEKYQDITMTTNYKLFNHGIISSDPTKIVCLEEPLRISQHSCIMKEFQGQYPVIYVNFKNVKGTNYEEILNCVKVELSETFNEHVYMIDVLDKIRNNEKSTRTQKKRAQKSLFFFETIYENDKKADESDVKGSLRFLSALLHSHFNKQVFVLLDEYDTPINNILQNEQFSSEDMDNTLLLFQGLMGSTLKDNKHLKKGLVTGIFSVAKHSLFSDLNNMLEYNFLDNKFAKHYGFTQGEIQNLLEEYQITTELSEKVKNWYNGYRFSEDIMLEIYNPWAIVNFLHNKKIKNYWEQSGNIDFIKSLFKINGIKTEILKLMNKEDVKMDINLKFSREDFLILKKLVNENTNMTVTMESLHIFFSYIFAGGYLTVDIEKQSELDFEFYITLPNNEVVHELSKRLRLYYEQLYNIPHELFSNATEAFKDLFESDMKQAKFQDSLQNIFSHIKLAKIDDIEQQGVHPKEDLFHSFLNVIAIQSRYTKFGTEVPFNTGFERGRPDIVLVNSSIKLGIIMEVKYNVTAEEGLKQSKKYTAVFNKYNNIKQIGYAGINITSNNEITIATCLEDYNQSCNSTSNKL